MLAATLFAIEASPAPPPPPVGSDVTVSPEILLGGSPYHLGLQAATAGDTHLFAWLESPGGVRAQRVSSAQVLLDPTPIEVNSFWSYTGLAVAGRSAGFLVLYGGATAQLVGLDGTLGDVSTVPAPVWQYTPSNMDWAAGADAGFVVMTHSHYLCGADPLDDYIFGPVIRTLTDQWMWTGGLSPGCGVNPPMVHDVGIGMATNGPVTIEQYTFNGETRMRFDGGPSSGLSFPTTCSGRAIGWDGESFLVVNGGGADLVGCRISPAGAVLDPAPFVISSGPGTRDQPSVTFDGVQAFVAFRDTRNGNADIYGNWVTAQGTMVVPGDVAIATAAVDESQPTVAPSGIGRVVVGYQHSSAAVRFVTGDPAALGVACDGDAGCVSGHCVDGVCCDSVCGGGVAGDCQGCSVAAGALQSGTCNPAVSGTPCDDADPCTTGDACSAGACNAGAPMVCPAAPACAVGAGACNAATGQCDYLVAPDGTACDGGVCTQGVCAPDGGGGSGGSGTSTTSTGTDSGGSAGTGAGGPGTTSTGTSTTSASGSGGSEDIQASGGCSVSGRERDGLAIGLLAPLAWVGFRRRRRT